MKKLTINHFAVWIASILHQFFAAGWYTLFAIPWMELNNKKMDDFKDPSPAPYIVSFIFSVIMNYVLAWVWKEAKVDSAIKGFLISALFALAFFVLPFLVNYMFSIRPISLALIDAGNFSINIITSGILLSVWRKYK